MYIKFLNQIINPYYFLKCTYPKNSCILDIRVDVEIEKNSFLKIIFGIKLKISEIADMKKDIREASSVIIKRKGRRSKSKESNTIFSANTSTTGN